MKYIFFSLFLFSLSPVRSQEKTFQVIHIEPHLTHQNYEHFKRLVLIADAPDAEFIQDFDFEWGYYYELQVEVESYSPSLSDGTRFEYSLVKLISKTKAPDSFEFKMTLDPNLYYGSHQLEQEEEEEKMLVPMNDSVYCYFQSVEMEVPRELRLECEELVENGLSKSGHFIIINEKRIRLIRF